VPDNDEQTDSLESLGLTQAVDDDDGVFNTIAVVGGGTMGKGLAQTISQTGIEAILIEKNGTSLKRALDELSDQLDAEIDRWGMTESEKRAILARVIGTTDIRDAAEARLVIEAIDENLSNKMTIMSKLDAICPDETILVTNTGSLSVTEIGSATMREDRVLGMHFLNPVPKIPLVELVRGLHTSDVTFNKARAFAERQLGKTAVEVFEYPGGITTRVIVVMLNEAMYALMEGVAAAESIDTAIRFGYNFPIGPLGLADQIGLDEVITWMEGLFRELGDQKYRPCPLLRKLVRAGQLGVKTGRGFFIYDEHGKRLPGTNV
jgi:3-hydroxybutyryl-CoA dehydrogenase